MKPYAKRLLALASAAAITLTVLPSVHATGVTLAPDAPEDAFAAPQSRAMEELVPDMIRSAPDSVPLTRQSLCTLAMDSYRSITGLTDEDLGQPELVFTDSEDPDVLNAYHLDLIQSQGSGLFDSEATLTRQDLWTVAANLLEAVGYPYMDDIYEDLSTYADGDAVIAYAKQPLRALLCLGAVDVDDGATLAPTEVITTGEAKDILRRVETFFTGWQEDPVEPQRYLGEEVAEFALNYVGCRYARGGQGPNKFDCSGFVYYVYKNFGYSLKPGARNQWSSLSTSVKKADLLPGDLVFFSRNGRSGGIFHVGIYIGDGQFVHAANSRKGLIVTDMDDDWYARRYLGAKRAIH